jgi:uncharacterized membrane protein
MAIQSIQMIPITSASSYCKQAYNLFVGLYLGDFFVVPTTIIAAVAIAITKITIYFFGHLLARRILIF